MGITKISREKAYFFFVVFFVFFLEDLANALTSESIIGVNLYLKFAKSLVSWLNTTKPKLWSLQVQIQPDLSLIVEKSSEAVFLWTFKAAGAFVVGAIMNRQKNTCFAWDPKTISI